MPYPIVLVECEEGVRTIGGLVGAAPADLRMDMPLVVDFAPSPDGDVVRSGGRRNAARTPRSAPSWRR